MRGLICLTPSNDVFQLEHKEILFGFKRIKLHNYLLRHIPDGFIRYKAIRNMSKNKKLSQIKMNRFSAKSKQITPFIYFEKKRLLKRRKKISKRRISRIFTISRFKRLEKRG